MTIKFRDTTEIVRKLQTKAEELKSDTSFLGRLKTTIIAGFLDVLHPHATGRET